MGEAEQETAFDLGDLFARGIAEADAIELARLAAGIDLLVGPPGDGFGMVESVAKVGERQQILLFRHGFFLSPAGDLTADSVGSIVSSDIAEPSPECRKRHQPGNCRVGPPSARGR